MVAPLAWAAGGDLDPTFGGDGSVTTRIGPRGSAAQAIAIQTDGKIVAAGYTLGSNVKFTLVRYNIDGTPDTTFGGDGRISTDFTPATDSPGTDYGRDVAVQADGRIVVAGVADEDALFPDWSDFAVARYNADGTPDTTFGDAGRVTTDFAARPDSAYALAIQTDGKIVVVGTTFARGSRFALARYNTDGALDTTFGGDGTVRTRVTTDYPGASAYGVSLQADGKIILVGSAGGEPALVRYNTDGTLDTTFGDDGIVITEVSQTYAKASAAAIQADRRIVTAGYISDCDPDGLCDEWFALARYEADGTLDEEFHYNYTFTGTFGVANSVEIQADGRIVAAGTSYDPVSASFTGVMVARYNTDGALDTTFGGDGTVPGDFGELGYGHDVALQADGRIVVLGSIQLSPVVTRGSRWPATWPPDPRTSKAPQRHLLFPSAGQGRSR